jgi:hypothetical protein
MMTVDMIFATIYMMIIQKLIDPKLFEGIFSKILAFFEKKEKPVEKPFVRIETVKVKTKTGYSYAHNNQITDVMDYIFAYLKHLKIDVKNCKVSGTSSSAGCIYEPLDEFTYENFKFKAYTICSTNDEKITTTLDIYGNTEEIKLFIDKARVFSRTRQKKRAPRIKVFDTRKDKPGSLLRSIFRSEQTFETLFIPNKKKYILSIDKYLSGKLSKISFLLHGDPGCGKTSFIKSLINYSKLPIFNIALKNIKTIEELRKLFFGTYMECSNGYKTKTMGFGRRIIIFEDIDADGTLTHKRSAEVLPESKDPYEKIMEPELTLSNLLNVLDGVVEFHGILIMTTNHVKKLDPALIRPGRITHNINLKKIQEPEISEMTTHYFGRAIKIPGGKYTAAELDTLCKTADTPEDLLFN